MPLYGDDEAFRDSQAPPATDATSPDHSSWHQDSSAPLPSPTHQHTHTHTHWGNDNPFFFASCLVKCGWIMHFIGWQKRPVRRRIIKQQLSEDASGHPSSPAGTKTTTHTLSLSWFMFRVQTVVFRGGGGLHRKKKAIIHMGPLMNLKIWSGPGVFSKPETRSRYRRVTNRPQLEAARWRQSARQDTGALVWCKFGGRRIKQQQH